MTQAINWKDLKRELIMSPPRPRTSKTFQHNDIFPSNDSPQRVTILKAPREQICFMTPKKVRENDNTRSHVFNKSDVKKEQPLHPLGKRILGSKSSLFREVPLKKITANPHRIPDHKSEFFYQQDDAAKSTKCFDRKSTAKEDIHVGSKYNSESFQKKPLPRSRSEYYIDQDTSDRAYHQHSSPFQRRLQHNKCNLFDKDAESNISETKTTQQDRKSITSQVESIKRINHNFSEVFGLEYGARVPLQEKKQQVRQLSPVLNWTKVDSIIYQKDIGSQNKPKATLNKSRSRVLDQKSTLDTHAEYEKPIPKSQSDLKATVKRKTNNQKQTKK